MELEVSETPLCLGLSEPLREARARKGFRNFQCIIGDSHSGKTFKNAHWQSNSPFRVGPPNCDRHVKFIFVTWQQTCYSAISVGENISNLWPSCYKLLRKLNSGGRRVNPGEFHVSCHTWGPSPVKKKEKQGRRESTETGMCPWEDPRGACDALRGIYYVVIVHVWYYGVDWAFPG